VVTVTAADQQARGLLPAPRPPSQRQELVHRAHLAKWPAWTAAIATEEVHQALLFRLVRLARQAHHLARLVPMEAITMAGLAWYDGLSERENDLDAR
jgi:hypothetical protein